MAGIQTAGFDMVIQFSEDFYENIIGSNFDMNEVVPQILESLHINEDRFSISVSLDRPTDIVLGNSAVNPIDISIDVFGENGESRAELRIVVGAVMNRSNPQKDVLTIDFENSLYYAKAILPIGGEVDINSVVKNTTSPIPVLPIPVTRNATDPKVAKRADFKIIDDTSIRNENVLSTMLTFGGGNQGNLDQLDSFVDDSGAMGIFFGWLCRLIIPKLEESLGIPANSFTNSGTECKYSGSVKIDEDEDVYLKSISLKLVDGYIQFDASVKKDGTCYEAKGDVSAKIKFVIEEGKLVVKAEIGDPDIDVDIPWYCYLAGAVLGIITGGLFGIVGAVVGGILIPLITWILEEIVESTFDDIADNIRDSINDNLPQVDIEAYGIEILFQDVFIDDVIMKTKAITHEAFPIRSEGVVRLRLGEGIDLDKGIVGSIENALNDINWTGEALNKYLGTGCEAAIASTNEKDMNQVMHFRLNGFNYKTQQRISEREFGTIEREAWYNPFYDFVENKKVLAVKTNGGRYSLLQIVEVEEDSYILNKNEFLSKSGDWVKLRYKTFEKAMPSVNIIGGFSCEHDPKNLKELSREFIPKDDSVVRQPAANVSIGTHNYHVNNELNIANRTELSNTFSRNMKIEKIKPTFKGSWISVFENKTKAKANLRAISTGTKGTQNYVWMVGEHILENNTDGVIKINDSDVNYDVKEDELTLLVAGDAHVEILVTVTLIGTGVYSVSQARCIKHDGKCIVKKRYIPTWKEFQLLNKQVHLLSREKFILRNVN